MDLYNENIKNEFLSGYSKDTKPSYRRIFEYSKDVESNLQKDLFDFTLKEIEDILYDLNPRTAQASRSYGNQIMSYLKWAMEEGYSKTKLNVFILQAPHYFGKFVDKNRSLYFSESFLRKIEDNLTNAQDAATLRLLFEGVYGSEISEARNLKKSDVPHIGDTLILHDDNGSERSMEVEERTIKLINQAIEQEIYYMSNGEMPDTSRNKGERDLAENDYVLRAPKTNLQSENSPVAKSTIYNRIRMVKKKLNYLSKYNNAIFYITSKSIVRSGTIYYAKKIMERDNVDELGVKHYKEIADKFKIKSVQMLKNYCNTEIVLEIYGS